MLPKTWKYKRLDEVAQFQSGNTPSKDNQSFWDGHYPWVTAKDMKSFRLSKTELGLTELGKSESKVIGAGTILVLTRGMTLLKDLPVCITEETVSFNQDIKALKPSVGIDSEFLALSLVAMKRQIMNLVDTAGHGTGRLDTNLLKDYAIPVPPYAEQKKISQILTSWDKAISTLERLIKNSQAQKRNLMRLLLTGARRLPGFVNPWNSHKMSALFSERVETGHLHLPLLSITREQGVISRADVGRKDTSSDDKSKYLRICSGDLGYNTMRMWQGVSALSSLEGLVSPAYTVITPKKKIDGKFAAYLLKHDRLIFKFYRHSQGLVSDTWNLKYRHFSEISVLIPEIKEQKQISKMLEHADNATRGFNRQLRILKAERTALIHQLLTGKRRVRVDQPTRAAA